MIQLICLFVFLPITTGYLLVRAALPSLKSSILEWSLGLGIGLALHSLAFFCWLLAWGWATPGFLFVSLGLWGVSTLLFLIRKRSLKAVPVQSKFSAPPGWLIAIFTAALGMALTVSMFYFLRNPHGNWDAWDTWNTMARFIFRGGRRWTDIFQPPLPRLLDYPLLLPTLATEGWTLLGRSSPWVPGVIGWLYTYGTLGVLVATVSKRRGWTTGLLAGLALLGTPFFLIHGSSQYADTPIGFYLLCALAMLSLYDSSSEGTAFYLLVSGFFLGITAWTKNEGVLFILAIFAARFIPGFFLKGGRRSGCSEFLYWSGGMAMPLAVLLYYKSALTPPNDLYGRQSVADLAEKASDFSRYKTLFKGTKKFFSDFGAWSFGIWPWLAFLAIFFGIGKVSIRNEGAALLALLLILLGYLGVYLTSPFDLSWHITTSFDRLLIQLWPSFLMAFFMSLDRIEIQATTA